MGNKYFCGKLFPRWLDMLRIILVEVVTDSNPIKKLKIIQSMRFLPGLQTVWCFGHAYFCDQVACRLIVGFLFKDALHTEYSLQSFNGYKQTKPQNYSKSMQRNISFMTVSIHVSRTQVTYWR